MLTRSGGSGTSPCQIFLNLVYPKQRYCDFSIFKLAAAATLYFWSRKIISANREQRVEAHQHAKYRQYLSMVAKILRGFNFSTRRPRPSWIFKFVKFHWQTVCEWPRLIMMLNVDKIGRSVAEILRFFEFWRCSPPPCWIFEITKFYWLLECRGFDTYQYAEFRQNRSICCKDIKFFDFSRWRPSSILDLFGAHLDHPQWVLGVSINLQNLVMFDAVVFIIWTFQYFARLAGKCLFTPPKIAVC